MTLFSFLKPYRRQIALTLFYVFLANVLSLVLPWGVKMVIDDVLARQDARLLGRIMLILTAALVLRAAFHFLRQMNAGMIGERIVRDLRDRIYWHIQKLSLGSIKKITPAQILTRLTGDAESVRRFISGEVIDGIYAVLSMGLVTAVLWWMNPRLTLTALWILPLFAFIYFRRIPRLKEGHRRLRDMNGRFISGVHEVLDGMAVVRVFTAEECERTRFSRRQEEMLKTACQNHAVNVGLWVGIEAFTSLGIIGILWLGGMDVLSRRMSPGELVAFYSYLGMLFTPVVRLVVIGGSYQEAAAALRRINEIFEIDDEVRQSPFPPLLPIIRGDVAFKDVSFGYAKQTVLRDITFSVREGEVVGIVGASGAGKTSLMNLLIRFFDPREGEIRVDGYCLKNLDLKAYRRRLAVVLQDDYLFNGTVEENIRYGRPGAPPEEVRDAARVAQAHDFIRQLKEGYGTEIGERGMRLSCGQRQRIAIARALLRQPSILILDEATSAVDALTENRIQKAVRDHLRGATIFIVAHRFSTIMEADTIIVLEKGEIVEMGGHNHLLKKGGFYSRLYFEQFKEDGGPATAESGRPCPVVG